MLLLEMVFSGSLPKGLGARKGQQAPSVDILVSQYKVKEIKIALVDMVEMSVAMGH